MKKLIAMLLALMLVVSLMACTAKEEAPVEEEKEEIAETPEAEEEPTVEDEPVIEDEPAAMPEEDPSLDEPAVMPEDPAEPEMPEIEYMPEEKLNEMMGLMDQLVNGINDELMVSTMEITADMYEYYGIPATEGIYAVVSMPMIGSIAHEVVLIELPEDMDAAEFAAQVEAGQNPMKWVCVQPETTWVKTSGNYVVAVMSTADMAGAVEDNFVAVFGA